MNMKFMKAKCFLAMLGTLLLLVPTAAPTAVEQELQVELSLSPTPPAVSVEALVEGCVWRLLTSADLRSSFRLTRHSDDLDIYHQHCIDKLLVMVCPLPLAFGYEVDANLPACKNPSWVGVASPGSRVSVAVAVTRPSKTTVQNLTMPSVIRSSTPPYHGTALPSNITAAAIPLPAAAMNATPITQLQQLSHPPTLTRPSAAARTYAFVLYNQSVLPTTVTMHQLVEEDKPSMMPARLEVHAGMHHEPPTAVTAATTMALLLPHPVDQDMATSAQMETATNSSNGGKLRVANWQQQQHVQLAAGVSSISVIGADSMRKHTCSTSRPPKCASSQSWTICWVAVIPCLPVLNQASVGWASEAGFTSGAALPATSRSASLTVLEHVDEDTAMGNLTTTDDQQSAAALTNPAAPLACAIVVYYLCPLPAVLNMQQLAWDNKQPPYAAVLRKQDVKPHHWPESSLPLPVLAGIATQQQYPQVVPGSCGQLSVAATSAATPAALLLPQADRATIESSKDVNVGNGSHAAKLSNGGQAVSPNKCTTPICGTTQPNNGALMAPLVADSKAVKVPLQIVPSLWHLLNHVVQSHRDENCSRSVNDTISCPGSTLLGRGMISVESSSPVKRALKGFAWRNWAKGLDMKHKQLLPADWQPINLFVMVLKSKAVSVSSVGISAATTSQVSWRHV